MKQAPLTRRLLAFVLAAAICFSLVPWTVFAAETGSYTQVTSAADFTSGKYVLITDKGYAPTVLDDSWVLAAQPTVAGGKVTDTANAVWTLTVDGSSVKLTDANGKSIAPKGGNNNGIKSGSYNWAWSFADGKFTFAGTGSDTVVLASNAGSENKFRAYKTGTVTGNPNGYLSAFTVYKLVEETAEPEPSEPVVPTEPSEPTVPSQPAEVISTVAEAKAMASGTENITVEATVIRVDGKNVVVQDATGGINLYFNAAPSDIAAGDVIRASGKRGAFNGLEQLTGVTGFTKTGTAALPLKEVTLAEILADQNVGALESTRVLIKGAVIGEISTAGNTPLTQGEASSKIFKIPALDGIAAGDTVDVIAVVSDYNGYQLRVNAAADVTKVASSQPEPSEPVTPEEPAGSTAVLVTDATGLKTGDQIIIVASGSDFALSTEQKSNNRGQAAVTKSEDGLTVTYGEDTQIITLEAGLTEGTWAFNVGGYLYAASASKNYLKTESALSANSSWTVEIADGIATVKATGSNTRNWLRYNSTSSLFSCYGSGQNDISIYRLGGAEEEPSVTFTDIADVLAVSEGEYTVKGVVTLVDGQNYYVQDATGGICIRVNAALKDVTLGDTLIGTGTRGEYNGLPQLGSATAEKSEGMTLTAKETTIGQLTTADICTYISLKGLTVTEVYDNNGSYTTPNITVTDGTKSIQLYRAVIGKTDGAWDVKVGDKLDLTCAVGVHNTKLQLRNTLASEITILEAEAEGVADGEYVIWAPAYNKALSSQYPNGSFYNGGVDVSVSGDALVGYGNSEIWTVTNNDDGTLTISFGGQALAMADSYTSMTLGQKNAAWVLEEAGEGLWYVKNVARNAYMQWYADKGYWSAYYSIDEGFEGKFALCFTPAEQGYTTDNTVVENIAQWGGMTTADNTQFVYGDKYVAGDEKDTEDIYTAVVSGKTVTPWTKGGNDDAPLYYMGAAGIGSGTNDYLQIAVNAAGFGSMDLSFRLRASNSAAGSFQLMYSADNGATWKNFTTGRYSYSWTKWGQNDEGQSVVVDSGVSTGNITDGKARTSLSAGNYVEFFFDVPAGADNCENLMIRLVPGTEKANGKDGTIGATATLRFDTVVLSGSPIVDDSITGYVTVTPDGQEDQAVGTELTMTCATEGAVIHYRVNGGEWKTYDASAKPVLEALPCDLEVYAAAEGKSASVVRLFHYAAGSVQPVKFTPNGGGIFIEGESAEITLSTSTEDATIWFATSQDGTTFGEYAEYTAPIVVEKGFGKLVVRAYAVKEGYRDTEVITRTFTERASGTYQIFFGQLHSHTNISDGSGSVEEAFQHASQVKNLDFLAVTDHSNSFDGADSGVLAQDGSTVSSEWKQGHEAAANITSGDFVGIYGYEMTWSNGLGHMNTFNTPGWQSRTQADYKTMSTALQNYYAALTTVPESISQFNHPGTTFGDFSDFGYYSETMDALITLVEVGNGEGAVGSSGYFPSYEYYTRALDKGWHVAPTNNQDNHKGLWGDANTGRSVVLADSLTPEGLYDAMRNYRVYATEDNDLNIYYTLNGYIMGTMLESTDVSENVNIRVSLSDATDSAIGKVEVIVNGGFVAASQSLNAASGTVELTVPATYNYYYIKVTQGDGDIAVTAPVWVGQVEAVGISDLKAESALTIAGEEQTFTADLFNNERSDLKVESLVYTDKATGKVIYTDTGITAVAKESTVSSSFSHTFETDGVYTITATLKGTLNGVEKTYTKDLEVTVMPRAITSSIIVDGTHFNDYVTGYYGGNMNNMTTIAAAQGIQVRVETNAITAEMLKNCSLLIVSAPARKSGSANAGSYEAKPFEDSFIAMVADYVKAGGSLIVCGLADYQDKGATNGAEGHAAAQLNKLLAAVGSTMRINDDEAYDDDKNGGQPYRLYPENFNMDSKWCDGIVSGQTYSQYSGCTVDPGQGTWLVKGFDSTYAIDSDKDGIGGVEKGSAYFLAVEESGFGGNVFVAGGVFVSDFEVKAELDNIWDLPYANRTIYENIIGITREQPVVTPIAEVRASAKEELGRIFVVEGYVTSGTDNAHTTFFDSIYVQDETGGITVFPYSQTGLELGTKVRITGYTDAYQGDIEIQIMSLEVLDAPKNVIAPEKLSNADAMDYTENGGELLQVEGEVTEVLLTSDGKGVSQFVVKDENGDLAKVFIDGYILSGTTGKNELADIVKVGNTVSAVGLLYLHPEGDSEESVPVLRVRNCDEVILISEKPAEPEIDKTKLQEAIDSAASKKQSDYTKKTWDAMQAALKAAKAVLADENATQEQVDTAANALLAAIRALAPSTGNSPETSDNSAMELYLLTMTMSMLAAAVLLLNRKRFVR